MLMHMPVGSLVGSAVGAGDADEVGAVGDKVGWPVGYELGIAAGGAHVSVRYASTLIARPCLSGHSATHCSSIRRDSSTAPDTHSAMVTLSSPMASGSGISSLPYSLRPCGGDLRNSRCANCGCGEVRALALALPRQQRRLSQGLPACPHRLCALHAHPKSHGMKRPCPVGLSICGTAPAHSVRTGRVRERTKRRGEALRRCEWQGRSCCGSRRGRDRRGAAHCWPWSLSSAPGNMTECATLQSPAAQMTPCCD